MMKIAVVDDEKQWVSHTKKLIERYYKKTCIEIDGYLSGIQFMKN